jgi:hypothetical protein
MLRCFFVRNSEFLATFVSARSQYATTVGGCHSFPETVLVLSLSARRLISAFHCLSPFSLKIFRAAKMIRIYRIYNTESPIITKLCYIVLILSTLMLLKIG